MAVEEPEHLAHEASEVSLRELSSTQLLRLYNFVTGRETKKFSSRDAGVQQTWAAIQVWREQHPDPEAAENAACTTGERPPEEFAMTEEELAAQKLRPSVAEKEELVAETPEQAASTTVLPPPEAVEGPAPVATPAEPHPGIVVQKLSGGEPRVIQPPGTQKPAAAGAKAFRIKLPYNGQTKEPKAGSKRARLLARMTDGTGIHLEEAMEAFDWQRKDAYEGMRLIHVALGYGLDQYSDTGRVYAHTNAPGKHKSQESKKEGA